MHWDQNNRHQRLESSKELTSKEKARSRQQKPWAILSRECDLLWRISLSFVRSIRKREQSWWICQENLPYSRLGSRVRGKEDGTWDSLDRTQVWQDFPELPLLGGLPSATEVSREKASRLALGLQVSTSKWPVLPPLPSVFGQVSGNGRAVLSGRGGHSMAGCRAGEHGVIGDHCFDVMDHVSPGLSSVER